MNERPSNLEDRLLDLHLGRLAPDERAALQSAMEASDGVRERFEAMGRVLRPLDHLNVPTPPAGLADAIMTRLPAPSAESDLVLTDEDAPAPAGGRFSMRDALALAACIALLICVVVPGVGQLRRHSLRTVCADQFKTIYRGLAAYARTHSGGLPNAGLVAGASWLYSTPTGAAHASNSRHAYLLVKQGYVSDAGVFVCPAGDEEPVEQDATGADDFAARANCSYDLLNMAGRVPSMADSGSMAYLADANPLFPGGFFDDGVNPNTTNSPLHDGAGQNVLCLNGEVKWMTTPFRNRNDNIWLASSILRYDGTETQWDRDDAFLVPATPVLLMSYTP